LTIIEGDSGVIVIDPLISAESAAAGIADAFLVRDPPVRSRRRHRSHLVTPPQVLTSPVRSGGLRKALGRSSQADRRR